VGEADAAGGADAFVSRLDSAGDLVWARQLGGTSFDEGRAVAVDVAGNVYTTGRFLGTADFDPGPDVAELTTAGGSDVFVSKLDSAGNLSSILP
ncbi:MAG: SBBP repeat-containing protein, partial [Acidimicrobiales bacterium]